MLQPNHNIVFDVQKALMSGDKIGSTQLIQTHLTDVTTTFLLVCPFAVVFVLRIFQCRISILSRVSYWLDPNTNASIKRPKSSVNS